MQLDAQDFLPLVEKAGGVCVFDIEATGLKGDYNSILLATVKPIGKPCRTFMVDRPGDDRRLVRELRDELHKYAMWVSFYGKGFDVPMLRARLLLHGMAQLEKRLHLDMYWTLKATVLTARRSQAHLLRWLQAPSQKMDLSPEEWNMVLANPRKGLRVMKARCESDCLGLEALYHRAKHLVVNVSK